MPTHFVAIWDTSLGRTLAELIPKETKRIVIDIQVEDAVRIYYECYASDEILNFNWMDFIAQKGVKIYPPNTNEVGQSPINNSPQ